MKALSELLLMGVKRAKSDFPLNSTILPDSATYVRLSRAEAPLAPSVGVAVGTEARAECASLGLAEFF